MAELVFTTNGIKVEYCLFVLMFLRNIVFIYTGRHSKPQQILIKCGHTIPTHISKQSLLDNASEVVWRSMDCQVGYSEVAKEADHGLQCRIVGYAEKHDQDSV